MKLFIFTERRHEIRLINWNLTNHLNNGENTCFILFFRCNLNIGVVKFRCDLAKKKCSCFYAFTLEVNGRHRCDRRSHIFQFSKLMVQLMVSTVSIRHISLLNYIEREKKNHEIARNETDGNFKMTAESFEYSTIVNFLWYWLKSKSWKAKIVSEIEIEKLWYFGKSNDCNKWLKWQKQERFCKLCNKMYRDHCKMKTYKSKAVARNISRNEEIRHKYQEKWFTRRGKKLSMPNSYRKYEGKNDVGMKSIR